MAADPLPDGVWPVMLTPFRDEGAIDWSGLDALVDWYGAQGVSGLFAVCLSSEIYQLTSDEKLALARRVVETVDGRLPIVAGATFGGPIEGQAEFARRMADAGVQAVVILTCQVATKEESDGLWKDRVQRFMDLSDGVPLGLYECPTPYRRLLGGELLGWAAATGRFVFHKDTSCSIPWLKEEIDSVQGTPLGVFNAHAPTLLESLRLGGRGYSGVAANFFPDLFVWLCRNFRDHPKEAERLQAFFTVSDASVRLQYPAGAKEFLRLLGLPIRSFCRVREADFDENSHRLLRSLHRMAEEWRAELGMARSAPA